jgi:hypothetical protein
MPPRINNPRVATAPILRLTRPFLFVLAFIIASCQIVVEIMRSFGEFKRPLPIRQEPVHDAAT